MRPEGARRRRRSSPESIPDVASRVIERLAGHRVSAVELVAPLPERVPLDSVHLPGPVADFVRRYEPRVAVDGLYAHQARVLAGLGTAGAGNVVLTSGTGSGKSLGFWAWIIDRLSRDPRATALVCFPTQALMWGQADRLARLSVPSSLVTPGGDGEPAFAGRLELQGGIGWSVWKGVGKEETRDHAVAVHLRSPSFEAARIRIATIDKAHWSLLSEGSEFARSLAAVVLDEAHALKGVFGANAHFFLKRLCASLAALGAPRPAVFLASATLADPVGFACRLADLEANVVQHVADAAPATVRTIGLTEVSEALASPRPDALTRVLLVLDDPDEQVRIAQFLGDREVLGDRANALYFSANKFASRRLRLALGARGGREGVIYDGDLPPKQRREVERLFNSGDAEGLTLIATSALELGVDIEGLDACLIDELPASRVDLLQRIGRVGRRPGRPGLVVLRAGAQPADRALAEDPAGALRLDGRRALPLPLHLDFLRLRHALACHDELDVLVVDAEDRERVVRRTFGTEEARDELASAYRERFGSHVDMDEGAWVYKGFRASATQGKIPVVELAVLATPDQPQARFESGERCDVAWLDDMNVFRDAHPEAVLLGPTGDRWRVVAYEGDWRAARQAPADGQTLALSRWLKALRAIYVSPITERLATRGLWEDTHALVGPLAMIEATPPRRGSFTGGVWECLRRFVGYREVDLDGDTVRLVTLAQVAERFRAAIDAGDHFPFLHNFSYRTPGWEWWPGVQTVEAVATLVGRFLAPYFAVEVEAPAGEMLVMSGVDELSRLWLRVLDAVPAGNGLSVALLAQRRAEAALVAAERALDECSHEHDGWRRLIRRLLAEDPAVGLDEVRAVVVALREGW